MQAIALPIGLATLNKIPSSTSAPNADMMQLLNESNNKITLDNTRIDSMTDKFTNLEAKLETFTSRIAAVEHDLAAAVTHTGAEIDTTKRQTSNILKKNAAQDRNHVTLKSEVENLQACRTESSLNSDQRRRSEPT